METKILIVGSHFTPAQALIEQLKNYNLKFVYVGRSSTREGDNTPSAESKILPALGVRFIPITAGRLQPSFNLYAVTSFLKIPIGFIQSVWIFLKEKPQLIVSFGGYVSLPIVLIGWLFSIPIIIHEQTLVIGLSNQISSFFANKIALSFKDQKLLKKTKYVLTGNPIRREFFDLNQTDILIDRFLKLAHQQKKPLLLVIGGNQGSHLINQTIFPILDELTKDFFVIHQTGDSKFKDFEEAQKLKIHLKFKERYYPLIWIKSLAQVMRNTDLAISRAGVNTLVELSLSKVPSIVIPIPNIYRNEQVVNAQFFKDTGLAAIIEQKDLKSKHLEAQVKSSLTNLSKLKLQAMRATEVVIKDAAKSLAQQVLILLEKNGA